MTVEIISRSISTKVWDWTGIELATPGSAVRHPSVARHVTNCAMRPGCGTIFFAHMLYYNYININFVLRERSGSVVERLTRDRGAAGSSLIGVTALCPWARHIYHSLVLVQPRKTRPYITEKMLMRHKESNQTNKQINLVLAIN